MEKNPRKCRKRIGNVVFRPGLWSRFFSSDSDSGNPSGSGSDSDSSKIIRLKLRLRLQAKTNSRLRLQLRLRELNQLRLRLRLKSSDSSDSNSDSDSATLGKIRSSYHIYEPVMSFFVLTTQALEYQSIRHPNTRVPIYPNTQVSKHPIT